MSSNRNAVPLEQVGFEVLDESLAEHFKAPISKRETPLDLIFTWSGRDGLCCASVLAGMKYGTQSRKDLRLCGNESLNPAHKLIFIDNQYTEYDHQVHLNCVKQYRPKYATSRDIMTREQCRVAGAAYYPLEQILDWAEEISQYAQNTIVIPKYDCLDQIPSKFMLGYSIPTSHGGTPLPVQMFKGRRIHLLGGNWARQLNFLSELGNDVVSIDNNHCHHISRFAFYYNSEGDELNLTETGHPALSNPRGVSLALSFGAMVYKLNQLYAAGNLKGQIVEETALPAAPKTKSSNAPRLPTLDELRAMPDASKLARQMLQEVITEPVSVPLPPRRKM